uniref:Uncharacterized protein n=1 Tax=Octopus bimaculoides TaxID=37653 RepID=A0A0L8FHX2_OCTBM
MVSSELSLSLYVVEKLSSGFYLPKNFNDYHPTCIRQLQHSFKEPLLYSIYKVESFDHEMLYQSFQFCSYYS